MQEVVALNKQQKAAAEFGERNSQGEFVAGPLLIIAGAGTGKTNTLAYRAANLIIQGVDPEKILLMTFSRRAAKELVARTQRILQHQIKESRTDQSAATLAGINRLARIQNSSLQVPWMGTFHSIANRLLRQYSRALGMAENFTIIDRNDAEDVMDVVRFELGFATQIKRFPRKSTCLNIYSRCVNAQQPLASIVEQEFPWCSDWKDELKQLFRNYTQRKIEQQSLDYDDLLLYWYHLAEIPQVAEKLRDKFQHILIDEYQDTNILQAGILLRLFPDGKGLTVVGDDAQSIYRFRSAEVENILEFPDAFTPKASVITLAQNYRSTQPILDLANQLLEEGKTGYKKKLQSHKGAGKAPRLVNVEDAMAQADYIVEQVLAERESGTLLKNQAVLFRSAHHSDQLEVTLMRHDIPFVKYGGLKFLEAAHVKDILAILRWAENPQHRISGFRILKMFPGIGPATASKALDFLALNHFKFESLADYTMPAAVNTQWQALVELLQVISQSGNHQQADPWPAPIEQLKNFYQPLLEENYEDAYVREGDIEQLVQIAQQYRSAESFISELTLDPPIASGDHNDDAHQDDDFLVLSTVHSAKGQEWKNVFVLNVTDGSFPNEYSTNDEKGLEEERRVLNVAITRAKQQLHLIQPLKFWVPEQPRYGDKHVYGAKSRFLTDAVTQKLSQQFWPAAPAQIKETEEVYNVAANIHDKLLGQW